MQQQFILKAKIIGNWQGKDKIVICWSVIDRYSQQEIYSNVFTGESTIPNNDSFATSCEAAKKSLEKLLSDNQFLNRVCLS